MSKLQEGNAMTTELEREQGFGDALTERLCFVGICPDQAGLQIPYPNDGTPNCPGRAKCARDCWERAMRKGGEIE